MTRMLLALCAATALVVSPALGTARTLPSSEDGAPSTRASAGGGPSTSASASVLAAPLQPDRRWRLPGKEGAGGAQRREAPRAPTGGGTKTDGTTETYAYNALGALSTHAGAVVDHQRPRISGGGSASAGLPATHGGQPVGLDAVGKVTSLAGMTLDWNRLGRLVSTTQAGVTTTYGHDSFFRRAVQQRAGSPLELYLYEGPNVAAVARGAGVASIDRRFLYDDVDHPLWMWDRVADAGIYFELDCVGNVRRLRGGARYGAGAALPSDLGGYKFTAFGRSVAADAGTPAPVVDGVSFVQQIRWQGRWLDTATGIYDVRNRVWSPDLAAFLSPDEFGYLTRSGTLWSWPGQNPVRSRDPFGLKDYTQKETAQQLADYKGALDNVSSPYTLMYKLHSDSGPLDKWVTERNSTWDVPGLGKMDSAEFGNFIAGYGSGHLHDPFALLLVRVAGMYYGLESAWKYPRDRTLSKLYFLGDDLGSVNKIHEGFGYGLADSVLHPGPTNVCPP